MAKSKEEKETEYLREVGSAILEDRLSEEALLELSEFIMDVSRSVELWRDNGFEDTLHTLNTYGSGKKREILKRLVKYTIEVTTGMLSEGRLE